MTLKELLADWTDFDVAQYYLACCLGLMVHDDSFEFLRVKAKHVFWSQHEIGNMLYNMLSMMAQVGILEFNEEDDKYRWNKSIRGSWELTL
jgi:hypothetical protein